MKRKAAQDKKVSQVMHKYKTGTLRSGSKTGPRDTSRRQAVAIALSQAGKARRRRK